MKYFNEKPTKKCILCVEDERSMAKMFKGLLEDEGYEVDNAYDGEEGIRMILTDTYDLITLDHVMPKMMGQEVLEKLKAVKLRGKLGMLTNITSDERIKEAADYGVNFYLVTTHHDPASFVKEINSIMNSRGYFVGPNYPKGLLELTETVRNLFINAINKGLDKLQKAIYSKLRKFSI